MAIRQPRNPEYGASMNFHVSMVIKKVDATEARTPWVIAPYSMGNEIINIVASVNDQLLTLYDEHRYDVFCRLDQRQRLECMCEGTTI